MSHFLGAPHHRRDSHSSDEGFVGGSKHDAAARRMFHVLARTDRRLASDAGLQAALRAVDNDDTITQTQLIEQLLQTAQDERDLAESGLPHEDGETIDGEEDFVDTLIDHPETSTSQPVEEDEKKEHKHKRKGYPKMAKKKIETFIEFVLAKVNQQWMFHNKSVKKEKRSKEVKRRLLELFNEEPKDVTHQDPHESLFLTENWDPYLNFVLALFVFILAIGAAGKFLPYCSLLCAIATFFSLMTFVALAEQQDHYAVYAVVANLVSCLPTILSRMRLSIGYWQIWRPVRELRFAYFTMSISLPSVALLSIPVAYFLMALRQKTWLDRLQTIVPHLVCIIWADIAMTLWMIGWQGFTYVDLLLTGSAAILFSLPSEWSLATGVVIAGAAFAQMRSFIDWKSVVKAVVTSCVLASPFIAAKIFSWLSKLYQVQVFPDDSKKRRWVLAMAYLLSLLVTISFLYQGQLSFDPKVDLTNMTWLQFEKHCAPTSANQVMSQIECSQLKGTAVQWKGAVQSVRVATIENAFESLLAYVPDSLGQSIRCFYDTNSTLISHNSGMTPNQCSLTAHNVYTFDLDIVGPYGDRLVSSSKGQLLLSATHAFTDMLKLIEEGDVVQFVAYFDNYPIFRYPPRLKLLQLECIHCKKFQKGHNSHLRITSSKLDRTGVWHRIFAAFKFFFHFIFAPFIRIR
ncbi:unnamed protein product, partial [Mesorhabditis belari]|uniref:Wolframin n=1 Tax=Mesorhabditis belari TaxID=2138241 RepID=A0AAF3FS86_9BILA